MRKLLIKPKKGEVIDMMIWLITIFILAVGLFIIIFVTGKITTGLRTANLNTTTEGTNAINSLEDFGSHTINYGFLFLFAGLIISMLITSFMVRSHPIWLFLYILFLGCTIFLGFYLGNAYNTLSTNPVFADMLDSGSMINAVMKYIAEITLAVGAISIVIVFAKFSTFGGSTQF